jgi:hypothetical protein
MGRGRKPKAVNEDAMKAAYINGDSIFSITRAFGVDSRRVKVILGIEPKHRAQTEKLSPLPPKARPQKDEPEPVDWQSNSTIGSMERQPRS